MRHSTSTVRATRAPFEDIAIIGMAGRFPGANNLDELRLRLEQGADCVGALSEKRIADTALPLDAEYLVAGYLDDIDKFDHRFFGISLGEAQTMGPNLRLALEVVAETLESSGYGIEHFNGTDTAVYASQTGSSYAELADQLVPTLITGNSPDFFATRIARQFNLTGPAMMVDTACSSSMTALHLACQALACGDAEHALVCGSNIQVFPMKGDKGGLLDVWAPDGRSRAFSANAAGMSIGEMVGAILLKPLRSALADSDVIHAIVKGVAINNNGARSSSPSAPDSVRQAEVIRAAWDKAGLDPETLGFIEAHGSGTKLGDSLEVEALSLAFRAYTQRAAICPISTIKGNIGHTHSSAGLAGLMKAVLSLKHSLVFPALHFDGPNPLIDFGRAAVYVTDRPLPFASAPGEPRRAAVHAFGMSGVNGHVVLEAAPSPSEPTCGGDGPKLVTLSSRTRDGLKRGAAALRAALDARPELSLPDVAFTLNVGRYHFDWRACVVAAERGELERGLEAICDGAGPTGAATSGKLVAAFSDCVEVSTRLIAALASRHAEFERAVRACEEALGGAAPPRSVVFQYAAYRTLASYGMSPSKLIGVGPGKYPNRIVSGAVGLAAGLRESLCAPQTSARDWMPKLESLLDGMASTVGATFLELGFNGALARQARATIEGRPGFRLIAPALDRTDPLMDLLASLYLAGHALDFRQLHAQFPGRRLDLPAYQFEKTRCWLRDKPKQAAPGHDAQPVVGGAAHTARASAAVPSSDVEGTIRGYWADVIGNGDFPRGANFFEVGGDSLAATRVVRMINAHFGTRLDFEDVFDFPTLELIAAHVRAELGTEQVVAAAWRDTLKLEHVRPEDDFFDLGGHSLLANEVLMRVRQEFGLKLSFDEFFQYPKLSAFARRVDELRACPPPERPASSANSIPMIGPAEHHAPSPAQKNLWVLCQLEGASAAYQLSVYDRIEGPLDVRALTRAIEAVVARHESLRTSFIVVNEEPRQRIAAPGSQASAIRCRDLSLRAAPIEAAIEAVNEESGRGFDLEQGPLFRTLLLKLGGDCHVLCFSAHHIIVDAWSFDVILNEVSGLYEAFREGSESRLPALSLQYKDYAAWLNAQLAGAAMRAHIEYWKVQLRCLPPPLEIEGDRPRPALKSFRGGRVRRTLPARTAALLRTSGEQHGATPFMLLLSLVKALLHRYTELSDLLVGTPMAGRELPELAGQVGLFMNLVPLRTRVDGSRPFVELLAAVKRTVIEAQQHQMVPFDVLVNELSPARDMGRSPLFDVLVIMQNAGLRTRANRQKLSVNIRELEGSHAISRYDLTFEFSEMPEGLLLDLEYNADLYDARRIEQIAGDFAALAERLLGEPGRAVSAVAFAADGARTSPALAATAHAGAAVVYTSVLGQCERTPDAIALVTEEGSLSYRELGLRAGRLAGRLQSFGVGPGDQVGICMPKRVELPVAMLGVWAVGAAFVPLDPAFPPARLASMVSCSAAKLILCDGPHSTLFDSAPCAVVAHLRSMDAEPVRAAVAPPIFEASLAYTMFTSGSTGEPKGVQVAHGSLAVLLEAMAAILEVGPRDVWVSVTAPTFDIAILELFLPLVRGARLVLTAARGAADAEPVRDTIMRERPTIMQATPSTWKFLTAAGAQGIIPQTVLCGGEALSVELAQTLSGHARALWNLYGPTETTIWSMFERVPSAAQKVPIGAPLPGTTAIVLGRALERRPLGFSGELVIGGAGVARGYARAPDATAAAFVPDAFSDTAGARMYRTGDMAVVPSAGAAIEFRGRRDSQIKVRGYRVELGEVERALATHASVQAVAVTPNGTGEGSDGLAAHLVARPGAALNVDELREHLRTLLPSYMIPSTFGLLDALPLTANGKLDRVKLRLAGSARPALPGTFAPPNGGLEVLIADIWGGLIGVPVGRADNFFEIGGHSLALVKAHARLQAALERAFPLLWLFQFPSVAQLADALSGDVGGRASRAAEHAQSRGALQRAALQRRSRAHDGGPRE